MNMKNRKVGYKGGFGERKKEIMQFCYNLKIKEKLQ